MEKELLFDIGIIGGGIAGTGIARDAALRGLKVILWEKNTLGSGTSSKSSKLIHGGIRYLELAWNALRSCNFRDFWKNFNFVIESLKECLILEKIAPHLIHPLQLVIPIYGNDQISPFSVYLGSLFYGFLGLLTGNRRLPRVLLGAKPVANLLPGINEQGLTGAVIIWDHWTLDQKLVEAIAASAAKHGAVIQEHTRVRNYQFDQNTFRVDIVQQNQSQKIRVKKLINASGAWVDQIRKQAGENGEEFIVPVAGSHICVKKFLPHSVILRASDKRIFFAINMEDHARIGTTERLHQNPDEVKITDEETDYLLAAMNTYFPNQNLTRQDVLASDSGIRPLAKPRNAKNPHEVSREHEIRMGKNGVLHVLGVKLTDHRRAAKEVLDALIPTFHPPLEKIHSESRTHMIPLQEPQ